MHTRRTVLLFALSAVLGAEVHGISLKKAVELALRQNPDVALARLDEQKAAEDVRIARDPFIPRVVVGSGLAYSSGFPMSIEGSAPSIVQAQATGALFNRPQSLRVAQAREEARGAAISSTLKRDEVVYRTATLYLEAERAGRTVQALRGQVENLEKVVRIVRTRLAEGRELPIEVKKAELSVARSRQKVESFLAAQESAERSLAVVLGFGADDRVRPVEEPRDKIELPVSEEAAIDTALRSSQELKRLESASASKILEIRVNKAERLPQIDLVAQYGIFARFNNYEDFFRKFQRHNGQIGMSLQIPLFTGPSAGARAAKAEADVARLRIEAAALRNRISLETRQRFHEIRQAESGCEVAKLDLDVAREQLSILLAGWEEGRVSLRQVEEARVLESEKWLGFYEAHYRLELTQLNIVRQTGGLMAVLR
jgi:outer membrane protein TolC